MYCWGSSINGELGLGSLVEEPVLLPTFNSFGASWKITQIESGLMHTLFLTEEGKVFSCGSNEVGQLGHNKSSRRPEHIDALNECTITQVEAGDQHSLALTSWGIVYSWGGNGFGQLGNSSLESHSDVPKQVKTLTRKKVVQLSSGGNHTLALTFDNEVYAWGLNKTGQLGLGHCDKLVTEPTCISRLSSIPLRLIKAGGLHSTALSKAGFLLTWGSNKYGQLGRSSGGPTSYSWHPEIVPNLATYSKPLMYVAAGENHTAVLDAPGKLWTFGQGMYGQLGHGNEEDSSTPKPVLDLVGSKVSQVACGRGHTLVYIPAQGQLYAFGLGLSGQLGVKSLHNKNLPQTVIGTWRAPSGQSISSLENDADLKDSNKSIFYIFAGGDSSFVNVSNEKGLDFCVTCPYQQPSIVELAHVDAMVSLGDDDMIDDDLFTYCENIVCSIGCWNGSFLKAGQSKVDHSLEFRLAEECMDKLGRITRETLVGLTAAGIKKATKDLPTRPLTPEGLRGFIILPLWKGFSDLRNYHSLQRPFADALLSLDPTSLIKFKSWLHSLPNDFLSILVRHYKKVVSHIIKSQKKGTELQPLSNDLEVQKGYLLSSLKVLDLIYKENKSFVGRKGGLPYEEFYVPEITETVDIRQDYLNWLEAPVGGLCLHGQICFCEYSFLFDSQAKTLLLRADATKQMQGAINEAVLNSNPLLWFINPNEISFLTLHVRRDRLVQDTLCQIQQYPVNELKKPLKVHFIEEEAEDAGGVRKEFFLLVLKELLNPDYGMFIEVKDSYLTWFTESAFEVDDMYSLIGIICGLAIYNFTIINLPFPISLYKKLLGESVGLDDLTELDPSFGKGLRNLLEYEVNDVEEVFCLNFTATQNSFGVTTVTPLKPGGEDIAVTQQNKAEYVDLIVNWRLNKSIAKQYQLFHKGFHRVCGGGVLKLFQPMELRALVTGNENYDWQEFKRNTEYKGEFYLNHLTIILFWQVFEELVLEQKKKFLMFLTGCDRIPILGMKAIKMTIQSTGDTNYLPVAHTCIIQLDLPTYSTKEKLKYKLLQAIQQSEGFGLV